MKTPQKPDFSPSYRANYNLRSSKSPSLSPTKQTSPRFAHRRKFENNPLPPGPADNDSSSDDGVYEHRSPQSEPKNVTMEEMSGPETPTTSIPESRTVRAPKQINWKVISGFVIGFLGLYIYTRNCPEFQPEPTEKFCKFDKLEKEYPGQDKFLWRSLEVGIENIINNKSLEPAVYLFLYKKNPSNEMILINRIANRASECFAPSLKPLEMRPEDFSSKAAVDDYGVAIDKYKSLISEGHVLLIAKLNDIPPPAARALHAICDAHNPIVNKVVIFLILEVSTLEGKPILIAENTLLNMWKRKIKDPELFPLITRITDQVVVVKR